MKDSQSQRFSKSRGQSQSRTLRISKSKISKSKIFQRQKVKVKVKVKVLIRFIEMERASRAPLVAPESEPPCREASPATRRSNEEEDASKHLLTDVLVTCRLTPPIFASPICPKFHIFSKKHPTLKPHNSALRPNCEVHLSPFDRA